MAHLILNISLQLFEVPGDFLILLRRFYIYNIAVDGLHDAVGAPAASGHNVLIRYADGMHDAGGIMAQVMKAEVGQPGAFNSTIEAVADPVRGSLDDPAFNAAHSRYDKIRKFDLPVAAVSFRLLDMPFSVFSQNHAL